MNNPVTFKTRNAFDHLENLSGVLYLSGRKLGFKVNGGPAPSSSKAFKVRKLCIGNPPSSADGSFAQIYSITQDVEMEFVPRSKQVVFNFQSDWKHYRISFALSTILHSEVECVPGHDLVVKLHFSAAPFFSKEVNLLESALLGLDLDKYHWQQVYSVAEREWIRQHPFNCRTIVVNELQNLGSYPYYYVNLGASSVRLQNDVFDCFSSLNLRPFKEEGVYQSVRSASDHLTHGIDFNDLDFEVSYLVHACISQHMLFFNNRDEALTLKRELSRYTAPVAAEALYNLFYLKKPPKSPVKRLMDELSFADGLDLMKDDDDYVRRVLVTPLRVCPQPAELDMSNRIIRQYKDFKERFIRVTFVDENFKSLFEARSEDVMELCVRKTGKRVL
jgi:RNA dependent RNA polymerase